jgi:putative ABC transport system permease protein
MRIVFVYIIIGVLVLIAAIINYINITTAGFILRLRAVGLKKILGISRSALLLNQFVETLLICIFSAIIGCLLTVLFLPAFNNVMQTKITFLSMNVIFIVAGVLFATVLLAAVFPAFYIVRQQGLAAFQGNTPANDTFRLRSSLVFIQLFVAFILLSVSILIFRQTDYLLSARTGFDADQLVVVNATGITPEQRKTLKTALIANASVEAVTMCSRTPGESLFTMGVKLPGAGEEERTVMFHHLFVDEDFLRTFGIPLQEGRFFSEAIPADSSRSFVINQAAASAIGERLLSGPIEIPGVLTNTPAVKTSVGVIHDFHFASLHTTVAPLIMEYQPRAAGNIVVRFRPSQTKQVIGALETSWKSIAPLLPLTHYFLDDAFAQAYASEQQTKQVVGIISVLVACLASLGIFGTSLFTLQQRTKEIGVRKLLGSGPLQLFTLVFRPTLFLLLGATLVGAPVAMAVGNSWLSRYPYHIVFTFTLMLAAFSIILIIILSTVIFYLIQIMRIQPANVLRQVR